MISRTPPSGSPEQNWPKADPQVSDEERKKLSFGQLAAAELMNSCPSLAGAALFREAVCGCILPHTGETPMDGALAMLMEE